ncbi:acyl-CoA reductase [Magnetovibrio sp. PR-2]|uniref:acyl-CoA reductase n=1 Tax=Magnetovibrio sp. PR-2 TaxID=3120356 RepID=UPI002FCE5840
MTPIPDDLKRRQTVLVGDLEQLDTHPVPSWDDARLAFLSDLSRALLAAPGVREFPDVVTFAYWCRKANLQALKDKLSRPERLQMGLGLVFHICPSNVPINAAFSLAFGLLAGNTCVLRLPSASTPTLDLLVETLKTLLNTPEHANLQSALFMLRYERDDDVNAYWMGCADGRIVWGGDETVQRMRAYPAPAHSREVMFTDRYSLCVLKVEAVEGLGDEELNAFCQKLYNDIYLMDQAACSSPQLIAWVGDGERVRKAQDKLWPVFADFADERYLLEPIQSMDKFVEASNNACTNTHIQSVKRQGRSLYRVQLDGLSSDQSACRGYSGTVHEVTLGTLEELTPSVTERYQTLTYFGYGPDEVSNYAKTAHLRGVDRIVPVGQALDMDAIWDGFDVIASLSRIVDVR